MMSKATQYGVITVCAFVIFGFMAYAVNFALNLPTVYFSYSTGECHAVHNWGDTNYTCESLPKRFTHAWVE